MTGTPWVASCTVTVDQDLVEVCSGPEAADSLTYGAFGEEGTREFFTHVRFHKHDEDKITIHLLVELYARIGRGGRRGARGGLARRARDHLAGRGVPAARRPSQRNRTRRPAPLGRAVLGAVGRDGLASRWPLTRAHRVASDR